MGSKLSQQEAERRINEYCIVSGNVLHKPFEYTGRMVKIDMRCVHGHVFTKTYNELTTKNPRCSVCSGRKKKTHEEAYTLLLKRCEEMNYTLCGDFYYHNNKALVHLRCNKDGHEWSTKYTSFVNTGFGCGKCGGTAKISSVEALEEIAAICKASGLSTVGEIEYKTSKTKNIALKCNKNNHTFKNSLSVLKLGKGCPKCSILSRKRNTYTLKYIYELLKDMCETRDYSFLKLHEFQKSHTRVTMMCNKDGHVWDTSIHHLKGGTGCPKCGGRAVLTQEEAMHNVLQRCDEDGFTLDGNFVYENMNTPIKMKCSKSHRFTLNYQKLVHAGYGCQYCAQNKRYTQEEAHQNLLESCLEKNLSLVQRIKYTNNLSAVKVQCNECEYIWNTIYSTVTDKKSNCPSCAGNAKLSQEEAERNVQKRCDEMQYTCKKFVYSNNLTRLELECHCGHVWSSATYQTFVDRKTGCAKCANRNHIFNYISGVYDNDILIAVKYGIEAVLCKRVNEQNARSVYEVRRLYTYKASSYDKCREAESVCIKKFQAQNMEIYGMSGVVTYDEMKDGWSETARIENVEEIKRIYEEHGAVLVDEEPVVLDVTEAREPPKGIPFASIKGRILSLI